MSTPTAAAELVRVGWWRRRTLRARLLIIGVVGLCLGLLAGGLALVAALGLVLQRSVDGELDRTATDVAALVDANALPQPVPVAGLSLVQVVDAGGRVRSASIDGDRLVPMLHPDELARARGGQRLFIDGDRLGMEAPVRVVALPAGPPGDPQTVIVARSMADVLKGVHALRTTLLIVFPVLVAGLAAVAWRVVGATLRPVENLRRGAAEITGTGQSARLPVPQGKHDEIQRLAVTLNDMLDRLDRGRARQREFVADAAHELRSPLTNMRTQLEVAARLGPGTDWPALADDLLADTARLSRLVDDLLLLARADEAPRLRRPEPVELGALVTAVAERYPTVTSTVDGPGWTLGEPDGLARVVGNLLDNAVRHARSAVRVAVRPVGAEVEISVADDGPGIAPADRDRVFERFTRLDDGRARDDGGAGLGLAIVRELVRRHHGTVRLDDAGPGLVVVVRLPARPAPVDARDDTRVDALDTSVDAPGTVDGARPGADDRDVPASVTSG